MSSIGVYLVMAPEPFWNLVLLRNIQRNQSHQRNLVSYYSEEPNMNLSLKLPNYVSIIQAEIMNIKIAARHNRYRWISCRTIVKFNVRKAAIRSLHYVYTPSKIMPLEKIAKHSPVPSYALLEIIPQVFAKLMLSQ